jgi:predicted GIY-YIG superfamily endonuclease
MDTTRQYSALERARGPVVYLIHLERPHYDRAGRKRGGAAHYLGYSDHLAARLAHHRAGTGSAFLAAAAAAGISFHVVRIWIVNATRGKERRLKNRHNHAAYCPICCPRWDHHGKDERVSG